MDDRAGAEAGGEAGELIAQFDARDALEVARLVDILSETIHCLDPDLARSAFALPRLKADNPASGAAGRAGKGPSPRRLRRRRRSVSPASPA